MRKLITLFSLLLVTNLTPTPPVNICNEVECPVSMYAGNNLGEQIQNAINDNAQIIDARYSGGEILQSITIPDSTILLLGNHTYYTSSPISLGYHASIVGLPGGDSINSRKGSIIVAKDGAELSNIVIMLGVNSKIQDLVVDGNKTLNGTKNGVGIRVKGERVTIQNSTVQSVDGDGIYFETTGIVSKLHLVMSIFNTGHGLRADDCNDLFILQSEFEVNGKSGIFLFGSEGVRIEHSDISGNKEFGLVAYNSYTRYAGYQIIIGNQFGNNKQNDLVLAGYSGHNIVQGNLFLGSIYKVAGQVAIQLWNNKGNSIIGNMIITNNTPEDLWAGIQFINPTGKSSVVGNVVDTTGTISNGIVAPSPVVVTGNSVIP